ncbi:keratin-associated protein 4-12-like [Amphibalanus amphitrite]|nr:keratin-associated protein 4-12-like [Amphibalanus amphitrite]
MGAGYLLLSAAALLSCAAPLSAGGSANRCSPPCRYGQTCRPRRVSHGYGSYSYYGSHQTQYECVNTPHPHPKPPPAARPPSCAHVRCSLGEVCVLQTVICIRPPCHPQPVCTRNTCAAVRCAPGTVCRVTENLRPSCTDRPSCFFKAECVLAGKPKPGFCPAPTYLAWALTKLGPSCRLDSSCEGDLLCCPVAGQPGSRCVAPAYPDPCADIHCPPQAPVCAVQNGRPGCRDLVCKPDTFFCLSGKQFYCSDDARQVDAGNLPC